MILTLIGLILLLAPFLLIGKFENRRRGFIIILTAIITIQTLIAVITQTFGVFNYPVVLSINLLLALAVIFKSKFEGLRQSAAGIRFDWGILIIIIVLSIVFYSIHYSYTGKITTEFNPRLDVKNMNYPYPYFSDEWSSVSLIKYSIHEQRLPFANPIWYNRPFFNFTFPFHSLLAELMLLLNLDPVGQYSVISMFFNCLICLLVYFVLRISGLAKFPSAVAAILVPYITNGANLPGVWVLIPINLGIISYLIMVSLIILKEKRWVLLAFFLSIVFYPPIIVFSFISLITYILGEDTSRYSKIKVLVYSFVAIISAAIIILIALYLLTSLDVVSLWEKMLSHIFFIAVPFGFPKFAMWNIIPLAVLVFSAIGLFGSKKDKSWLISPVITGLVFWMIYSFTVARFIISYERVVFATSVLLIISAGFGISYSIKYLEEKEFIKRYKVLGIIQVAVILLVFVLSFSYTERENWSKLDTVIPTSPETLLQPACPANKYILPEDIANFENITNKSLLSLPWKTMIISIITDNYAITTKEAQLNTEGLKYSDFINANCTVKQEMAMKNAIDYVYTSSFECTGFTYQNKSSSEGLYLYKFGY